MQFTDEKVPQNKDELLTTLRQAESTASLLFSVGVLVLFLEAFLLATAKSDKTLNSALFFVLSCFGAPKSLFIILKSASLRALLRGGRGEPISKVRKNKAQQDKNNTHTHTQTQMLSIHLQFCLYIHTRTERWGVFNSRSPPLSLLLGCTN